MKKFLRVLAAILFISSILVSTYIRFTNIDMTEMRLFVEYWYVWLMVAGACGIALYIFYVTD